ncbi:MAG: hypothetical protein GXP31_13675 [Kiritimatiellaeota bacterium]|nr:hypothetical protein [Kiritimatiellota bacterium]
MNGSADFYVALNGNDAWSGRRSEADTERADGPFATIERARNAVRALKEQTPSRNISVWIRGGTYRLRRTVVFSPADSAPAGHTIVYAAFPGETPIFTSAAPIRGWRRADPLPRGLPVAARGHVWVADVSAIRAARERAAQGADSAPAWPFRVLYHRGRRLPRARGPGFSPTNTTPRARAWDHRALHFPEGTVENWPDFRNGELVVIPCYFWTMNILPLDSVDAKARILRTAAPATYPMGRNGMTDRPVAWIENVTEVLDRPGEWVLDAPNAKLYYWPENAPPDDGVAAPLLTELFRVEGRIETDGPADTPVSGLVFRGLTFTGGDRFPWHGRSGWGLQHDWEMFDRPTALVRFRGAANCAIEHCRFMHSGHAAVRLDLTCEQNRIVGNHIQHMGGVGILLAGYGPGTKDVNTRNEIANNYIHDIGQLYWGSPAVFVWQSGENRIAHNHIHHVPYTGIVVSGRIAWDPQGRGECSRTVRWRELGLDPTQKRPRWSWKRREPFLHARRNIIEYNDIHNVMEVLGDGNCIYVSGAGADNVVRKNFCHDCRGLHMNAGIRCDDDQYRTRIEGNLIWRNRGAGEGIISKGDNDILNNVIADLRPDTRHRGYIVFPYGSIKGAVIQRNILYSCRRDQALYFEGRGRRGGSAPRLRETDADFNLYFCTEDPQWGKEHLTKARAAGIETHSLVADPRFVDPDSGAFEFRPDSPGPGLGIRPLGLAFCGLESPWREEYVGRRIHCRIAPAGCELRKPVMVRITCDAPGAEVHYTLDDSAPTRRSPLYTAPFRLDKPAVVRARAFLAEATDLTGAFERFTAPPASIRLDFERVPLGAPAPGATTMEEDNRRTARVSDEQAAGGRRSLKFVDGPGQKHPFNPHVFFRLGFHDEIVRGRFALWLDENTTFLYQWRDYDRGRYRCGPTIQVRPGGELVLDGKPLIDLPLRAWVRFDVVCSLGDAAATGWQLSVVLPGEKTPRVFPSLSCQKGFRSLDWVGFVANGRRETAFYVDDIVIEPAPP